MKQLGKFLVIIGFLFLSAAFAASKAHAVAISASAYNIGYQDLYIQPNGNPATSDYHTAFNWSFSALINDNHSAATLTLFNAHTGSVFANFISSNVTFSFWDNNNGYDIVSFWSDSFVDASNTYSPIAFGLYGGWDDTSLFNNGLQNVNQGISNVNYDAGITGDLLYYDDNTAGLDFNLTVLNNNLQPVAVPEPATLGLLGLGLLGLIRFKK